MTTVDFTHRIKYRSILGSPKKPYSLVRLFAPDGSSIRVLGIIDSGADACTFKSAVADSLGIKWSEGDEIEVTGVEGSGIVAYQHHLLLQIEPIPSPINCVVLFSDTVPQNLIGRESVFECMYICFHEANESIYLRVA